MFCFKTWFNLQIKTKKNKKITVSKNAFEDEFQVGKLRILSLTTYPKNIIIDHDFYEKNITNRIVKTHTQHEISTF